MIGKLGILLVGILLYSCQKPKIQEDNGGTTIPFVLTEHNNLSIEAILNKSDTVDLMFHTAASSMTLTKKATKRLNITWDHTDEVNSWGGNATSRYSKNNKLDIGNLQWDSIPIWENENSGPATDGKFGPDLFEGNAIEINFDKSEITIHQTLPEQAKDYLKTSLIFENEFMFIEGVSSIESDSYLNRFLIHSGYGGTILFDDKFTAESKISERIEIKAEKELKDSYGNILKSKKGKLPKFSIGTVDFKNIPVGFFEGSIGRQQVSVLGGDLLKRFNIIIDPKREYIYLKPNQLMKLEYSEI
ncbi:aspartyl protease family protein [Flammeovirgaceae bacterium SG7u.111]|nr:aspartyl protease family protein [Flammeovirgaceae bacterium SG7u.132]WPO37024.1 aspartyl protease family protein [Flammeovirgaceae bacterium SG7u.111]